MVKDDFAQEWVAGRWRVRGAIRARGHFPTEHAALKCLYLVTRSLDPTGRGKARWAMRWKPALNAFAITFNGRIKPDRHLANAKVGSTVNRTALVVVGGA